MATMQDEVTTSIIKSDRIGRPRYQAQYKAEVLAAYETSGLSGPAFARECGIKYSTFASWVTKVRKSKTTPEASLSSTSFLVAEIDEDSPSGSSALEVTLSSGASIRVANLAQVHLLAELLKTLA
jgi:transposase-like protein